MNRCAHLAGMVVLTSLFATSVRAQPMVTVLGDATCPSADMIRAALPAARPVGDLSGQKVAVEVTGERLSLLLGEAPGVRREIPADPACSVRAESVAVVIAAWSGELGARPADSPVLTMAAPAPVLTPVQKPVQKAAPAGLYELEGSAFYSPLWGHAPGGALGLGRMSHDGGFGGRLLGAYQSARDIALEGGTNQILRLLVGAALTYRVQRTHVFASGDVGLVGTYTRAQGTGYEPNQTSSTTNFGALADLRGGLRFGRFSLWLSGRGLRLAHTETVKVQSTSPGVADSSTLTAWDLQLGVGLGVRFE
jgi:hypothetical protein